MVTGELATEKATKKMRGIAKVIEKVDIKVLKKSPVRITLPDAPAPTSKVLEDTYYITEANITDEVFKLLK